MIHVNWEKNSLIFSNYAIINQKKHRMNKELYMGIVITSYSIHYTKLYDTVDL